MTRPKSNVPSYRKHRSGQARVTIIGRDYYRGPHGTKASKREYDRLIAEYLASGRSLSFGSDSDAMSMAMLMADYIRFAKKNYGTGTTSEWHRIKLALKPIVSLYSELQVIRFDQEEGLKTSPDTIPSLPLRSVRGDFAHWVAAPLLSR